MYSSKNYIENPYLNVYYIFKVLMNLVNWKCDIPSDTTTQAYFYSTIFHHKVSYSSTTQEYFLLNNCAPKHALLLHYKHSKKFLHLENGTLLLFIKHAHIPPWPSYGWTLLPIFVVILMCVHYLHPPFC
jgi:hypothetical protein